VKHSPSQDISFFTDLLDERIDYIQGLELALEKVGGEDPVSGDAIRLTFDKEFDRYGGRVTIGFQEPIKAELGGIVALISETFEYMNRVAVSPEPSWKVAYDVRPAGAGAGNTLTTPYLITGMAALTIISTALFGFSGVLIELRHVGALRPFQIMPVKRTEYLAAFSVSRAVVLLLFSLIFIYGANAIYSAGIDFSPQVFFSAVLTMVVGIAAFLGIGLAIAAFMTKPSTAHALINVLNIPIIFLSDLFIPVSIMPAWLQNVAEHSPVYLFVNLLRRVLDGGAITQNDIATLALLALIGMVFFSIAIAFFKWRTT